MILRVWTHWLAAPPAPPSAPTARPASLSGYTGTVTQLPITGAAPQFSTDWIITPVVAVWAELATQDDIYVAGWGGPGWPGAPPPAGDEGYSTAAGTVKVTGVSVIMDIANTEFTFTIRTPAGNVVGTITPASPAAMPGMYPVTLPGGGPIIPVPNGKGDLDGRDSAHRRLRTK